MQKPQRYLKLEEEIIKMPTCLSIMEIGVHKGNSSAIMLNSALRKHSSVKYYGFDVFEDMTPALLAKEVSKKPFSEGTIRTNLESISGSEVFLYKGFSQETIPSFCKDHKGFMDFIFLDGGHSEETIKSDWKNIQPLIGDHTIIILDDYIVKKDPNRTWGCNFLIDNLDDKIWKMEKLPPIDEFNWGSLQLVKVQKNAS
jgi:predicted O-methyltransferase YrrM